MEEKELIKSYLNESNHKIPVIVISLGVLITLFSFLAYGGLEDEYIPLIFLGIVVVVVGIILLLYVGNCQMVVTNKRVYGKAAFGRQVDLPIDSISAVATSYFDTVSVSTSSGRISFVMLANKDEMVNSIRELIINRQNISMPIVAESGMDVEELRKYKSLFDEGVISEEEFNAKKKQILDL